MAAAKSVSSYIKNVGKSIVYATIDVAKHPIINGSREDLDNITDFVEETDDIIKSAFSKISSIKESLKNTDRDFKKTKIYDAVSTVANNFIEDIKTGNFYNNREMEFDMGFDDFDDDYSSNSSFDNSSSQSLDFKRVESAISSAANAQAMAIAEGVNITTKTNIASTRATIAHIEHASARISSSIGAVYGSIESQNKFLNGPVIAHINNSSKYYEATTKLLQEQVAMTKELLDMQQELYGKNKSRGRNSSSSGNIDDILKSGGMLNFGNYFKNIKNNFENSIFGMMFSMGSMLEGFGGKDSKYSMIKSFNPLAEGLKYVIEKIIPEGFKKSIKSLDDGIGDIFSNLIAKINYTAANDYDIKGSIADLFKVGIQKKEYISTSGYKKGPIPFDGETKKSIIEVIPGYLARIEAALTGNDERHYDLKSGRWINAKDIERKFKSIKSSSIASANSGIRSGLEPAIIELQKTNPAAARKLQKSMQTMMEVIYNDGGYFQAYNTEKFYDTITRESNYRKYGFDSEEAFNKAIKLIGKKGFRNIAKNNMNARNSYTNELKSIESSGSSIYNLLFNDAYKDPNEVLKLYGNNKGSKYQFSKFAGGTGLLAISTDDDGKNVFWYLRNILDTIKNHKFTGGSKATRKRRASSREHSSSSYATNNQSSRTSEDGESDPDSDDSSSIFSEAFASLDFEADERNKKENEVKEKKERLIRNIEDWYNRSKLGRSRIGKFFSNITKGGVEKGGVIADILRIPFNAAAEVIDRADNAIFKVMFGETFKDEEGNDIDSVFGYMIHKIKTTFNELKDWLKNKFFDPIKNWLKDKISPLWDKFGRPVANEALEMLRGVKDRTKEAFGNTFGKAFYSVKNSIAGKFGSADDIVDYGDIKTSAYGRIVNKRGLTMISPGEIIINPKNEAGKRKDLKEEKIERRKIAKALGIPYEDYIDLNANGNVKDRGIEENLKRVIKNILTSEEYNRIINSMKNNGVAKIGAGGVIGSGLGFLTGYNPIITGIIGSGISFIKESSTAQKFLFGERDNPDSKGIIPKKVVNIFEKSSKDITDFGIAGGALGLLTPFGILGGAGIGAGVALLKNSDRFNTFLFGEEGTDKKGLISKELYEKFKAKVKDSVPNIAGGAVLGALTGPFGLLGNSIIGAGLGLFTATDTFHKFMYGEDGSGGGLTGAIHNGIIVPAKKTISNILSDLNDFSKKYILKPLKNFWDPFKQGMKNAVSSITDGIKDAIADSFEKNVGLPFKDFMQEKLFRPIGKIASGLTKAILGVTKSIIKAPMSLLSGIGNNMRLSQIRSGTAYDMTAQERLDFRRQHSRRQAFRNIFSKDKMIGTDEMLAGMDADQLSELESLAQVNLYSRRDLGKTYGQSKKDLSQTISDFVNARDENGNSLFDKGTSYKIINKITKAAQTGDIKAAEAIINSRSFSKKFGKAWTDDQKNSFLQKISGGINRVSTAEANLRMADISESNRNDKLKRILGRNFKGRKDTRQILRAVQSELKGKGIDAKLDSLDEFDNIESSESEATNTLTSIVNTKANSVIGAIRTSNLYLRALVTGESIQDIDKSGDIEKSDKILKNVKKELKLRETNEDSKKAKEAREKLEKEEAESDRELEATEKSSSILERIHDKLFGDKDKDKNKGNIFGGILGKLAGGLSGIGKFLGVGGKIALGVGAVSLFGHASTWFKDTIFPKLKELFDGTVQKISDWLHSEKFQNFINNSIRFIANGLEKSMDILIPVISTLAGKVIANIPSIGKGLIKGSDDLLENLTNPKVKKEEKSYKPVSYQIVDDNGTVIEYDEDNNILTDYSQFNKGRTTGSTILHSSGRSFLKGITTGKTGKIGGLVSKAAKKLKIKPSLSIFDNILNVGKGAVKVGDKTINAAGRTGVFFNKVGKEIAEKGLKTGLKDITSTTISGTKNSLKNGILKVFKWVAESKIGKWIINKVNSAGGKQITEEALEKAFKGIGENVAEEAAKKGTAKGAASVAKKVGSLTPVAIALWIIDFLYGFSNAETLLGIADEDNYSNNVFADIVVGLVHCLNENLLLGIIPTSTILNLFIDGLFPLFGIDVDSINESRSKADSIISEWNRTHPEEQYDSIKDYNNRDSVFTKRFWTNAWEGIKNEAKILFGGGYINTSNIKTGSNRVSEFDSGRKEQNDPYNLYTKNKNRYLSNDSAGLGHIYQKSPFISNIRYGSGTLGTDGCAPVAAANVLSRMSGRGHMNLIDAASYAERNNMTSPGGGTNIDYFNSYFNSKGIRNTTTSDKNKVYDAISSGHQVVMLGKDKASYSRSPFGKGNHFITAIGKDKNGNIIVEDPDLPQRAIKYNKNSVMNSMKKSVITGIGPRSSKSRRNFGRLFGRARTEIPSNKLDASAIINIARSQIGTPAFGEYLVCKYNDAYWGKGNYEKGIYGNSNSKAYWCVVFVWWVFNQAGAGKLFYHGNKTASTKELWRDCTIYNTPKVGDIAFFDWVETSGKPDHVGIVTAIDGDQITTIEGNTTYDNFGSVVAEKTRNKKYFCGFYHPNYPYEYDPSNIVNMSEYGDSKDYMSIAFNSDSTTKAIEKASNSITPTISDATSSVINSVNVNSSSGDGLLSKLANLGKAALRRAYPGLYDAMFESSNNYSNGITPTQYLQNASENGHIIGREGNIPNRTDTDANVSNSKSAVNNYYNSNIKGANTNDPMNKVSSNYNVDANNIRSINYTSNSSLPGIDNREKAWNYFINKGYSKAGTAGILGNIAMESGFKPDNVENTKERMYGNDDEYTKKVNNGTYSRDDFVNGHKFGYGLPGFTWWSLKDNLYKNTVDKGRSIGDLEGQLDSMFEQFSTNFTDMHNRLKTATSAKDAANDVLKNYERPGAFIEWEKNNSYAPGIKTISERQAAAEEVYNDFAGSSRVNATNALKNIGARSVSDTSMYMNTSNSVDYSTFMKTIVDLLLTISGNTALLTKILEVLSKNFNLDIDKSDIEHAAKGARASAKDSLNRLIARSVDNNRNLDKVLNNDDAEYLLNAMTSLARE